MALSDPQSVTINAVAQSLPRVGDDALTSKYQKDDGTFTLDVSHRLTKTRKNTRIRLSQDKISADPYIPAVNRAEFQGVTLLIDRPIGGFTITEQKDLAKGLCDALSASSYAMLIKILGGEH